ncbi:MAG: hypothetical protein FWG50_04390 [Kiritimatiellaeota bacterium]|nr:hypothetical protein [Kiritimatiellota bacterium]
MLSDWEEQAKLLEHPERSLNGLYENKSPEMPNFWQVLTYSHAADDNDIFQVEILSDTHLELTLISSAEKSAGSVIVSYKPYPRRIALATQHHAGGMLMPILWMWDTEEFALGITPEHDLAVRRAWGRTAMLGPFPFFGGGGGAGLRYVFKRVAEPKLKSIE